MPKFYRTITPELEAFVRRQKIFFTATAPTDGGRINLSPKGYDTFRILDDRTVCYLDFPGSGNETANHIRENGRITFMWCSFETRPLILRLYCYGELVEKDDPRYVQMMDHLYAAYDPRHVRRIVLARVEAVQTSCGWAVPFFEYRGERRSLAQWSEATYEKGELEEYIEVNAPRVEEKYPLEPPGTTSRPPRDAYGR